MTQRLSSWESYECRDVCIPEKLYFPLRFVVVPEDVRRNRVNPMPCHLQPVAPIFLGIRASAFLR
jgi:hypothetical protein